VPWEELSQTFKDAIRTTQKLGFRYLWIDSLSTIQDNPASLKEESSEMALICGLSFLTICASRAKDGDGGLFPEKPNNLKPLSIAMTCSNESRIEDDFTIKARRLPKHYFQGMPPKTPSDWNGSDTYKYLVWQPASPAEASFFTRAWAVQERVLSERALDFYSIEIISERHQMRRYECGEMTAFDTQKRRLLKELSAAGPKAPDQPASGPYDDIWLTGSA
jgi:Heterokaryon incompatibility protein (HET)